MIQHSNKSSSSSSKEKLKEFCSFFFAFHASKKNRRINRNHTYRRAHIKIEPIIWLRQPARHTADRQTSDKRSIYLSKWLWLQFISRSAQLSSTFPLEAWLCEWVCYYSIRSFQMIFSRIFIVLRLSSAHRQSDWGLSFYPKRWRWFWLFSV